MAEILKFYLRELLGLGAAINCQENSTPNNIGLFDSFLAVVFTCHSDLKQERNCLEFGTVETVPLSTNTFYTRTVSNATLARRHLSV